MINTRLDTKFENFLSESKLKIKDLGKELECLETENAYLDAQVFDTFHLNSDLRIQAKNLEDQVNRFNTIHAAISTEHKTLQEKLSKAKIDYERLLQAYLQQSDIINTQLEGFKIKESSLRNNRKTREELFEIELNKINLKISEINKTKQLKQELNNALKAELNDSEAIEASILTSIQAEILNLSSITSKSFYKANKNSV
jgi:hypothetical protein